MATDRPGSASRPLVEMPTYPVELTRIRRSAASWGIDSGLLPTYAKHLDGLELKDPTPALSLWERARDLHREAYATPASAAHADLAEQLASGKLTAVDVAKAIAKVPNRAEAAELARTRQAALRAGASRTLLAALQSLFDLGEPKWLDLLRPIVEDALATGDDVRLNAAHRLAQFLRDPHRAKIGALTAAVNNRYDCAADWYRFKRPDLEHRWRVSRSSDVQRRELARYVVDGQWRVQYALKPDAPRPTIADFQPEWGAGLWSAEEVVENVKQSLRAQEVEFAKLVPPPPAPPAARIKKRRVVAIV